MAEYVDVETGRAADGLRLDRVREALDPALLEHRDYIYRTHLTLPVDT